MQHKLVKNFDWQSTEGQSLLRMKYDLYQEYLQSGKKDDGVSGPYVSEEFLNQAILIAYRKGRSEIYQSERDVYKEVCSQLIYELEAIKERGSV